MQVNSFDVLVAGAGPAGSTIARILALKGCRVLVVDPHRPRHSRMELISPGTLNVVEALGLTHLLIEEDVSTVCLGIRRSWGHVRREIDEFIRHPGGRGYIIDRQRFDKRLRDEASRQGVRIKAGMVVSADAEDCGVRVRVQTLSDVSDICVPVVVDASGRPAAVARRLGARRVIREHLVASLRSHASANDVEIVSNWLDVVRLGQHWQYSVLGPRGMNQCWAVRRGKVKNPKALHDVNCDASSASLTDFSGQGWLAIGDAATAFDPMTSQGLGNALSMALVAAGLVLSGDFFAPEARASYSDIVRATFLHSELGRLQIYADSIEGALPNPLTTAISPQVEQRLTGQR